MTKITSNLAKEKLELHLKNNCLDVIEEIIPFKNIESSYYFRHEYEITEVESTQDYWIFTIGNQRYRDGYGYEQIGPPHSWLVDKIKGHCIYTLYFDDYIIYKDWILKHKIFNSKQFYHKIKHWEEINLNLSKGIFQWYHSNILDEYSLLSYLENCKIRKEGSADKLQVLQWFELLKTKKAVNNLDLIEGMLTNIPFSDINEKENWKLTKRILDLSLEDKLRLHNKTLREKEEHDKLLKNKSNFIIPPDFDFDKEFNLNHSDE